MQTPTEFDAEILYFQMQNSNNIYIFYFVLISLVAIPKLSAKGCWITLALPKMAGAAQLP